MAIDYGEARIGIALSDPLKIIASGYETLKNDNNILESIYNLCKLKNVESIILGIPFDNNSEIGNSAKKVLCFAENLLNYFKNNNFNIQIYEQDERYSTHEAYETIKLNKVKTKKKKKVIDQIAAAKILSSFMQSSNKIKLDLSKYNY
jgi:putative Holliday junction resolvase